MFLGLSELFPGKAEFFLGHSGHLVISLITQQTEGGVGFVYSNMSTKYQILRKKAVIFARKRGVHCPIGQLMVIMTGVVTALSAQNPFYFPPSPIRGA